MPARLDVRGFGVAGCEEVQAGVGIAARDGQRAAAAAVGALGVAMAPEQPPREQLGVRPRCGTHPATPAPAPAGLPGGMAGAAADVSGESGTTTDASAMGPAEALMAPVYRSDTRRYPTFMTTGLGPKVAKVKILAK